MHFVYALALQQIWASDKSDLGLWDRSGEYQSKMQKHGTEVMPNAKYLPNTDGAEYESIPYYTLPTDAGFDFQTVGHNRRRPVDFDGLKLVAFDPPQTG